MKKYITQDKLKRNNTADIFSFVLERGKTTRREIQFETGFSWGTVSANVAYLYEKGFIKEEKIIGAGVGRATYALTLNGDVVSIGLDINRSGLKAEVVGLDLSVKRSFFAPFTAENQEQTLSQAEELIRTALDWCEGKYKTLSLGVAVQGAVNGKEGVSLRFPRMEWEPCNLKERFGLAFDLPVYLAHDPRCMLLAALCKKKRKDCVLVRIDEGVGMAVSQNYKLLNDTERLELGHIITPSGERLEEVASIRGICKKTGKPFEQSFTSKCFSEGLSALKIALFNACVLFRPQALVLSGRAFEYPEFSKPLLSELEKLGVKAEVDVELSAAFGVAAQSMKSAVENSAVLSDE